MAWYLALACAWILFLTYVAREAFLLVELLEVGPLGLGVHYGLNRWDEYLDHDAIKRRLSMNLASKFIDDARLPPQAVPKDLVPGHAMGWPTSGFCHYGAAAR